MIREDTSIRGIPIPGPDGELTPAPAATRLVPHTHTLKERGLVDDTMIALASSESIPPLLRVLDRFEAIALELEHVESVDLRSAIRKADAVLPAFARAGQRGDTLKRVAQFGRCRLLFLLGVQHIV